MNYSKIQYLGKDAPVFSITYNHLSVLQNMSTWWLRYILRLKLDANIICFKLLTICPLNL